MVVGSFCGFERGSKKCFLVPVVSHGSDVLLEVIKKWVRPVQLLFLIVGRHIIA